MNPASTPKDLESRPADTRVQPPMGGFAERDGGVAALGLEGVELGGGPPSPLYHGRTHDVLPPTTGGIITPAPLPTPTLSTARLRLRPFDDADADDLFALHSDPRVLRYWDAPPWNERGRAERFIAACRQMAEEGTGVRLAVDRAGDTAFIGWCSLNRWNPDHRSASLGYCFDRAAWGHGYATEAARAVLRWAFDTLDLNRVQAETDTRNVASARVLEKLGFVREGTLREDCVVDGEVSSSWVYGLIRREWRPAAEPPGDSPSR